MAAGNIAPPVQIQRQLTIGPMDRWVVYNVVPNGLQHLTSARADCVYSDMEFFGLMEEAIPTFQAQGVDTFTMPPIALNAFDIQPLRNMVEWAGARGIFYTRQDALRFAEEHWRNQEVQRDEANDEDEEEHVFQLPVEVGPPAVVPAGVAAIQPGLVGFPEEAPFQVAVEGPSDEEEMENIYARGTPVRRRNATHPPAPF